MRLYIKISSSKEIIPFNHQHLLVGVIHKWLGENTKHGKLSLYSFSRLQNAELKKNGLKFSDGSSMFFSAFDKEIIKQLVSGIIEDPDMFNGLKVLEVAMQETPNFESQTKFHNSSPIFIKRNIDERVNHFIYSDNNAGKLLEESLHHKMEAAGLPRDESLKIEFDMTYLKASTKLVNYKGINNKCSWCPVLITSESYTKAFAWEVGLGNSTGIGFGALK